MQHLRAGLARPWFPTVKSALILSAVLSLYRTIELMFKYWKLETRDTAQSQEPDQEFPSMNIYRRFLIACSQRQEQITIR